MRTSIKNTLRILLLFLLAIPTACENDDVVPEFTLQEASDKVAFTSTFSDEYLLSMETASNIAERLVWSPVSFGVPTEISYQVQWSTTGNFDEDREDFVSGTLSETNFAVSVGTLMQIAKDDLGLDEDPGTEAGNTGTIHFRIRAFAGTGEGQTTTSSLSDPVALNITLIEITQEDEETEEPFYFFRDLYLVGNAIDTNDDGIADDSDWNNNANNLPLVRSADNENLYSFIGRFLGDGQEFKLLETKGQWQPQWGLSEGSLVSSDELGGDPSPFTVPTEGYYEIILDIVAGTFTAVSYDESASTSYSTIGIIGNATKNADDDGDGTPDGWQSDIDMIQSTFNAHLWFINDITLEDGEIKFRAEDDWATNWGGGTEFSGYGTQDGPNIPARAATYDIWFNDLDGSYMLIPSPENAE